MVIFWRGCATAVPTADRHTAARERNLTADLTGAIMVDNSSREPGETGRETRFRFSLPCVLRGGLKEDSRKLGINPGASGATNRHPSISELRAPPRKP